MAQAMAVAAITTILLVVAPCTRRKEKLLKNLEFLKIRPKLSPGEPDHRHSCAPASFGLAWAIHVLPTVVGKSPTGVWLENPD